MKKFTSLMAIAALAGTAVAATPVALDKHVSSEAQLSQVKNVTVENTVKKAPAKKVASINDVLGLYNMTYEWALNGEDNFGGSLSPNLVLGDNPNEVIIKNCPYSDLDIVAQVDLSASTISIAKQDGLYNDNYGEMMVWQPETYTENGPVAIEKLVGTITENGIMFPEMDMLTLRISQGYFLAFINMQWSRYDFFEFNEANYIKMNGKAEYIDQVVNMALAEEYRVGAISVDCYARSNGEELVVYNPYQGTEWIQYNGISMVDNAGPGYIVVNISYPEVAWVRPLVNSGFWMNNGDEYTPIWDEMYLFNMEGYMIFVNGYTAEEVYDEYTAIMDTPSSYDSSTGKANLINMYFGFTSDPLSPYYFPDAYDNNPQNLQITFPALDGVESVEVAEEGAVKYYNMHGMEVINPAKGELVIKKQGNKAVKVVM